MKVKSTTLLLVLGHLLGFKVVCKKNCVAGTKLSDVAGKKVGGYALVVDEEPLEVVVGDKGVREQVRRGGAGLSGKVGVSEGAGGPVELLGN